MIGHVKGTPVSASSADVTAEEGSITTVADVDCRDGSGGVCRAKCAGTSLGWLDVLVRDLRVFGDF